MSLQICSEKLMNFREGQLLDFEPLSLQICSEKLMNFREGQLLDFEPLSLQICSEKLMNFRAGQLLDFEPLSLQICSEKLMNFCVGQLLDFEPLSLQICSEKLMNFREGQLHCGNSMLADLTQTSIFRQHDDHSTKTNRHWDRPWRHPVALYWKRWKHLAVILCRHRHCQLSLCGQCLFLYCLLMYLCVNDFF